MYAAFGVSTPRPAKSPVPHHRASLPPSREHGGAAWEVKRAAYSSLKSLASIRISVVEEQEGISVLSPRFPNYAVARLASTVAAKAATKLAMLLILTLAAAMLAVLLSPMPAAAMLVMLLSLPRYRYARRDAVTGLTGMLPDVRTRRRRHARCSSVAYAATMLAAAMLAVQQSLLRKRRVGSGRDAQPPRKARRKAARTVNSEASDDEFEVEKIIEMKFVRGEPK
ncbi:hypothetical protein PHYSODRAFT_331022 [Phytophthora sojae]|uniref:Transmembrane protein n=1 Tax=Phytophthora sojae (strain P6497) TaxID=1094619 RepID=G4ZES2_PHYSP|nr:hypothetical protein PHYSODRAFT_331022 [Phytophthora sojae]EGZ16986.1 hypothetical protein PHYSODRAFT_331022 [Phytophthora sojae]|eukprot:XP_009526044.1 hypothetical protein PHYSODRAFT_331022 [Phytophthora sojae]